MTNGAFQILCSENVWNLRKFYVPPSLNRATGTALGRGNFKYLEELHVFITDGEDGVDGLKFSSIFGTGKNAKSEKTEARNES